MNVHLAILVNPYLDLILHNQKTIETRLYQQKRIPYHRIHSGDLIYFKKSGGDIVGSAFAQKVEFLKFTTVDNYLSLIQNYRKEACLNEEWIEKKKNSKYGIFIYLRDIIRFTTSIPFVKKDQLSWLILNPDQIEEIKKALNTIEKH